MEYDLWLSYKPSRTVTAQLYLGNVAVGAAIATTEVGSIGEYYADVPAGTAAGDYIVVFFDGPTKVVSGVLNWDGTGEVASGGATAAEVWTYSSRTLSSPIEADVRYVNGIEVKGSGLESDPWGPA